MNILLILGYALIFGQLGVRMENSPARLTSHILLWIIVAGIGIWLIYSATHTNTENNRFAPGSNSSDNHSTRWPLTFDFNMSCVRNDSLKALKPDVSEVKK